MKTTIDIAASLLRAAKRRAVEGGVTLKEMVEEALRQHLQDGCAHRRGFRLRRHTFRGRGLQPGIVEGSWEQVRDLIYPG